MSEIDSQLNELLFQLDNKAIEYKDICEEDVYDRKYYSDFPMINGNYELTKKIIEIEDYKRSIQEKDELIESLKKEKDDAYEALQLHQMEKEYKNSKELIQVLKNKIDGYEQGFITNIFEDMRNSRVASRRFDAKALEELNENLELIKENNKLEDIVDEVKEIEKIDQEFSKQTEELISEIVEKPKIVFRRPSNVKTQQKRVSNTKVEKRPSNANIEEKKSPKKTKDKSPIKPEVKKIKDKSPVKPEAKNTPSQNKNKINGLCGFALPKSKALNKNI